MIDLTPDLTGDAVVRDGVLRLTFADGLTREATVLERMRGPVLEAARTRAGFRHAFLEIETGTVTWPALADLAPDVLYEDVRRLVRRES